MAGTKRRNPPKRFYVVTRSFRALERIYVVDDNASDAWDVALESTEGWRCADEWEDDTRFDWRFSRARRIDALDVPTGIVSLAIKDRAFPRSDELAHAIETWNESETRFGIPNYKVTTPRRALAERPFVVVEDAA